MRLLPRASSHTLRYAIFYAIHHLFVFFYVLLVAHTFDHEFRAGRKRPQIFRWISVSACVYLCDRLYRNLSAGWSSPTSTPVIGVTTEHYTLDVRLDRPFKVGAGDWAHIWVPSLSTILAHPFSVSQGATLYDVVFVINRPTRTASGKAAQARAEMTWRSQLLYQLTGAPNADAVDRLAMAAAAAQEAAAKPASVKAAKPAQPPVSRLPFGLGAAQAPAPTPAPAPTEKAETTLAPTGGGMRYLPGRPINMKVMGPYSSSFPALGLADQVICIGLGSGCVAVSRARASPALQQRAQQCFIPAGRERV